MSDRSKDPRRIVAESVLLQKPVIVVSINYRLNIFAFGDGNGGANLALYDQRNGIAWVQKHIASFGGDPVWYTHCSRNNISDYCYRRILPLLERVLGQYMLMRICSPSSG